MKHTIIARSICTVAFLSFGILSTKAFDLDPLLFYQVNKALMDPRSMNMHLPEWINKIVDHNNQMNLKETSVPEKAKTAENLVSKRNSKIYFEPSEEYWHRPIPSPLISGPLQKRDGNGFMDSLKMLKNLFLFSNIQNDHLEEKRRRYKRQACLLNFKNCQTYWNPEYDLGYDRPMFDDLQFYKRHSENDDYSEDLLGEGNFDYEGFLM